MKNRSTDLIDWNDVLTIGMGLSGSCYGVSHGPPPVSDHVGARWLITVDGAPTCAAETVQDALARSEGLEALRCILKGLCDRISDEHCRVAEIIASEMLEAGTKVMERSLVADRRELAESVSALRALHRAVRSESRKRQQREGMSDAFPLPH